MSLPTQAQQLSRWVRHRNGTLQVLAITSGKAGVGKSYLALQLAQELARQGQQTLVLDGDPTPGKGDLLAGVHCDYTLADVLQGRCTLDEAVAVGPGRVAILTAGTGLSHLTPLREEGRRALLAHVAALPAAPDVLLLDTAAGIGKEVQFLTACAQEVLVVTSPDPTAITDAYALMKVMCTQHDTRRFRLVVNLVEDRSEALSVYRRLSEAGDQFLGISVDFAGFIPFDPAVAQTRTGQRTGRWQHKSPGTAQAALLELTQTIQTWQRARTPQGNVHFYRDRISGMSAPGSPGGYDG